MRLLPALLATFCLATPSFAATCGGSFSGFVEGLKAEARAQGHSQSTVDGFFRGVAQDGKVLKADRAQGVFQKPFVEFSRRLISQNRIDRGRRNAGKYAAIFDRIERDYGVSRGVLLAFWAFETDYGAFQGDFNTRNALVTLAHDCRRPVLFRPQVLAAVELYARGGFDPARTTGAWAGEIGMVQMLPRDILDNGVDGDGDGQVDLKGSAADALMSGGKMLAHLGWRAGEPWLQEVTVPQGFDWAQSGLEVQRPVRDWAALGVRAFVMVDPPFVGSDRLHPLGPRRGRGIQVTPSDSAYSSSPKEVRSSSRDGPAARSSARNGACSASGRGSGPAAGSAPRHRGRREVTSFAIR